MKRRTLLVGAGALSAASLLRARRARGAGISDGVVKIGVLDDMSGVFADQQGMGDYVSARMAAEDFGGSVSGAPIEVIRPICRTSPMSGYRSRVIGSTSRRSMRSSGWGIPRSRSQCRSCARRRARSMW